MKNTKVTVYKSNITLPIPFVQHTWLVSDQDGVITRWEVLHRKKDQSHLHINRFPPFKGLPIWWLNGKVKWRAKELVSFSGEKAQQILNRLQSSKSIYPNNYGFFGPNSNTYTQWILKDLFKLPFWCIGKDYPIDNIR